MTRLVILTVFVSLFCFATAHGAVYTLDDGNSTVQIDDSSTGVSSWIVDGAENLFQQWFWYRIGDTGGESSVDTLGAPVVDDDDGDGYIGLTYADAQLSVELNFTLGGGQPGSLVADLGEIITINNVSGQTLDLHFFQYVDFDLVGDAGDDTVQMVNPWVVKQTDAGSASWVSETVVVPAASLHEVGLFSDTLDSLEDTDPTTLDDSDGPLGPDDVTWAFQWDFTLSPGGSFLISKNKHVAIPEPATLGLLLVGGLVLLRRRTR